MKFIVVILFVISIAATVNAVSFWPHPADVSTGSQTVSVDPKSLQMTETGCKSPLVEDAWHRAMEFMKRMSWGDSRLRRNDALSKVEIKVTSCDANLEFQGDESYKLTVNAPTAQIEAETVFGAMYAIETFTQTIVSADEGLVINEVPITVNDKPRFPWRGMLIDTSRHWLPLDTLKDMIRALAYNKFNVFHWHVVDAIAFPMESKEFPLLTKGAWNPRATYTAADVSEIVSFAKDYGVRVVAEFDVPGHAHAWGVGYPNITATCPNYEHNPNNIALNPAHQQTFDVVKGFLEEMVGLFPDAFLHLGGDELVYGCWLADKSVTDFMKTKGFSKPEEVEDYFIGIVYPYINSLNRTVVSWQEVFASGMHVPEDTVIEVWKDSDTLNSVVNAGYRGILAFGWYMDQQGCARGEHYEFEDTWVDMYNNEPTAGISSHPELVIGGEAAMWGEQVDATSISTRVWPRACAPGERLWSPKTVTDVDDAKARLIVQRCRMAQRGIMAGPIAPDWCDLSF